MKFEENTMNLYEPINSTVYEGDEDGNNSDVSDGPGYKEALNSIN